MIGLEYEKIFYDHLELKAMIKIYNRLKKRIEECKNNLNKFEMHSSQANDLTVTIRELQKILGEEK